MSLSIKRAITSLVLSVLAMLLADYIDSLYIEGYDSFNPLIIGVNLLWLAVVAWIIYDILKKKSVNLSLYAVSVVMIYFTVSEYLEVGFIPSQIFRVIEIILILLPVYFLKSENKKRFSTEK